MDQLIEDMSRFKDGWENIQCHAVAMEEMQLNLHDYLAIVYPEPDGGATQREISIRTNIVNKIKDRVKIEGFRTGRENPEDLTTVSGWQAYNGAQGYMLHDTSRRNGTTPFDRFLLMQQGASGTRMSLAERTVFDLAS